MMFRRLTVEAQEVKDIDYDASLLSLEELEEDYAIASRIEPFPSALVSKIHDEIVSRLKSAKASSPVGEDPEEAEPDEDLVCGIPEGWGLVPLNKVMVPENINLENGFRMFKPEPNLSPSCVHGLSMFYNTGRSLDRMGDALFRVDERYFVEQKFSGLDCSIHKDRSKVVVYAGRRDVSKDFKPICDALRKSPDNFILVGSLVPFDNGRMVDKVELIKRKGRFKPECAEFMCWDITYYNRISLHDTILSERKKILSSLKLSSPLREVPYMLVSDPNSMKQAVAIAMKAPPFNGVLLKDVDSIYPPKTEKTDKWVDYHDAHIIDLMVGGVESVKGGWSYSLCIIDGIGKKVLGSSLPTQGKYVDGSVVRVAVDHILKCGKKKPRDEYMLHKPEIVCMVSEQYKPASIELIDKLALVVD